LQLAYDSVVVIMAVGEFSPMMISYGWSINLTLDITPSRDAVIFLK
jgi:hypothetical protein